MPLQIRCEADDSLMVYVPGGLFLQGEDGVDPEAGPAHPVELDPFYMDQTEVTLSQFELFRSEHVPRPEAPGNSGGPSDHPAVGVPWRSAQAYCRWSGKELPTEAEWEKAARGPDGYLYPWGDGRVVWERARTPSQIDPVASFRADRSVYGVFDLAGNAREWCADNYAPDIYARDVERSGGVVRNPEGPNRPAVSGHRVIRGNAPHWQLWYRSSANMAESPVGAGFRCVLRISLPEEGETVRDGGNQPPPTRVPGGTPANRSDRGF
jgi:formylglycine-generating enzyme required for sulfatase activity